MNLAAHFAIGMRRQRVPANNFRSFIDLTELRQGTFFAVPTNLVGTPDPDRLEEPMASRLSRS